MNSGAGDTTQLMPGYPIRTPWDQRSVDNSPRPIAASHVLHRLLVPRHPPCALSNLTTKMLASTVQFSTNTHPHPPRHNNHPPADGVLQPEHGSHQEPRHTPTRGTRLFSQDPTGSLDTATNPAGTRLHTPPRGSTTGTQPQLE